jgi:hypothetical protein
MRCVSIGFVKWSLVLQSEIFKKKYMQIGNIDNNRKIFLA